MILLQNEDPILSVTLWSGYDSTQEKIMTQLNYPNNSAGFTITMDEVEPLSQEALDLAFKQAKENPTGWVPRFTVIHGSLSDFVDSQLKI